MTDPRGADVLIEWVDTKEQVTTYFSFGEYIPETETDSFGVLDDSIFYYAKGVDELRQLMTEPDQFKVIEWELIR